MCVHKMLWGISETVNARAFIAFAIVFRTPENLLLGMTAILGLKESHFLA